MPCQLQMSHRTGYRGKWEKSFFNWTREPSKFKSDLLCWQKSSHRAVAWHPMRNAFLNLLFNNPNWLPLRSAVETILCLEAFFRDTSGIASRKGTNFIKTKGHVLLGWLYLHVLLQQCLVLKKEATLGFFAKICQPFLILVCGFLKAFSFSLLVFLDYPWCFLDYPWAFGVSLQCFGLIQSFSQKLDISTFLAIFGLDCDQDGVLVHFVRNVSHLTWYFVFRVCQSLVSFPPKLGCQIPSCFFGKICFRFFCQIRWIKRQKYQCPPNYLSHFLQILLVQQDNNDAFINCILKDQWALSHVNQVWILADPQYWPQPTDMSRQAHFRSSYGEYSSGTLGFHIHSTWIQSHVCSGVIVLAGYFITP